jgi:hypothetical protein
MGGSRRTSGPSWRIFKSLLGDRNVCWRCYRKKHWTTHLQGAHMVSVQGLWCHVFSFYLWVSWSIEGRIHSKRRNRLSQELVERLLHSHTTRTRGLWESLTVYSFYTKLLKHCVTYLTIWICVTGSCWGSRHTHEKERDRLRERKREKEKERDTERPSNKRFFFKELAWFFFLAHLVCLF